jgi:hypothetical protein
MPKNECRPTHRDGAGGRLVIGRAWSTQKRPPEYAHSISWGLPKRSVGGCRHVEAARYRHVRPNKSGEEGSLATPGLERGPPVAKGPCAFLRHCLIPYGVVANGGVVLGV